ncbi:hypothetical protein HanLR1_Chr07g0239281 [Helianthus annuus]|nr:hypothetical protein HanLR1_Chr07g0239281 [Helianthus annuus]
MESSVEIIGDGYEKASKEATVATTEALKKALAHIRVCSKLEGLLLKKKMLYGGETPEMHAQKVDKLKALSESLVSSSTKAEKRISDNRYIYMLHVYMCVCVYIGFGSIKNHHEL